MRGPVGCASDTLKVKAGGRYVMGPVIVVSSIREIALSECDAREARAPLRVRGLVDLLKVAKHGPGERVFLLSLSMRGRPARPTVPCRNTVIPAVVQPRAGTQIRLQLR